LANSQFYKNLEDTFRGSSKIVKKRLEVYVPFLRELPSYTSSNLVVDLGCGRGEWLCLAQRENVTAKGTDINDAMLNEAILRGLDVENCDAITFLRAQEEESVGLITAFHLVEHLPFPDLLELLVGSYRCLAPGGIIILETPNPENLSVAVLGFNLDPTHMKPLPPALLAFAVEQCGFERTKILRLNENVDLRNKAFLALTDVLTGVSPDYSIIAQKSGSSPSAEIDQLFSQERGITLESLAHDYDGNLRQLRAEQDQLLTIIMEIQKKNEELSSRLEVLDAKIAESIVSLNSKMAENVDALNSKIAENVDALNSKIAENVDALNSKIAENIDALNSKIAENVDALNSKIAENIDALSLKIGDLAAGVKEQGQWVVDFSGRHAVALASLEKRVLKLERGLSGAFVSFITTKFMELYWTITRSVGLAHLHDGSRSLLHDDFQLQNENSTPYGRLPLAGESVVINIAYLRLDAALRYIADNKSGLNEVRNRPRLAFVSPLPPQRTGVADYSNDLLPALSEHYEIVAIVEDKSEVLAPIQNVAAIMDAAWFKVHALEFDRIVYQFGNSANHAYMIPLLRIFPGVLVMHDFFLGHFIGEIDKNPQYAGIWMDELYRSEGYSALMKKFTIGGNEQVVEQCPVNFTFMQHAQGIIFHSQYSYNLARAFYGEKVAQHCSIVAQGIVASPLSSRVEARAYLGIKESAFVVCSFGFVGPNKLSQKIFDAWKVFRKSGKEPAELVFVGACPPCIYNQNLSDDIAANHKFDAKITGYVSQHEYRSYLAACDVAIQLRTNTRGETSRAALECMSVGIPTIVSNHGPFAEIPDHCVFKVADDCSIDQLAQTLELIISEPQVVKSIGFAAQEFVKSNLSIALIADQYFKAIEEFSRTSHKITNLSEIMTAAKAIVDEGPGSEESLRKASLAMSSRFDWSSSTRQLFIDVSALVKEDLNTGVQRVVKEQLAGLLRNPPNGIRVEPIYISHQMGETRFRYANSFTTKLLGLDGVFLDDRVVSYNSGDIYYMPDLCYWSVQLADESGLYHFMQSEGVRLSFLVYDNLPVMLPEYFPKGANMAHEAWLRRVVCHADQLICISRAVREDVASWVQNHETERLDSVKLDVLHLGANFRSGSKSYRALDAGKVKRLASIKNAFTFLIVGTIEPRKGHLQALDAFDELWSAGNDITLLIVGAEGWRGLPDQERRTIPEITRRIKIHPQYNRKLFWINDADDEYLELIYQASSCLLMVSENEGFGLPLIEAANFKLPVIARDIPVFRELLGEHGYFFEGGTGSELSKHISNWLEKYRGGDVCNSGSLGFLTWEEHIEELKKILNLR